jgi:hypothetical protein
MKYTTTTMSIAIHPETENPVFGEYVTTVALDDEAGGAFLLIKQVDPVTGTINRIRVDFDEFDVVADAVRILRLEAKRTKGFE